MIAFKNLGIIGLEQKLPDCVSFVRKSMTVKEFSEKIGIPSTKIRFYDRSKLIEGSREQKNNYRTFCELDALSIFNAQMLRSFDFSLQEVHQAKEEKIEQINSRVRRRIEDLENSIRMQEIKLIRLKEMRSYFSEIENSMTRVIYWNLPESYNIFTINCNSTENERQAVKMLAEVMPFSYICIKICRESILKQENPLKVSLGLGILKKNKEITGLNFSASIKADEQKERVGIRFECQNPFALTVSDLEPLLAELASKKIEIKDDLLGRIFISYKKNGKVVHGLSVSLPVQP